MLQNGKVLIVPSSLSVGTAFTYDPVTKVTSATGWMMSAHSSGSTTLLRSGLVLVAGGNEVKGRGVITNNVAELYDPDTDAFTTLPGMIDEREQHAAVLLSDGSVLITGGFSTAFGNILRSAEIFASQLMP